jgi:hypothetical protein
MSGLAPIATELMRRGSPPLRADFAAKVGDQRARQATDLLGTHPVSIRSIESGEDAVILATAAVMQHTKHRLVVVVEQPIWRAAVGSVR